MITEVLMDAAVVIVTALIAFVATKVTKWITTLINEKQLNIDTEMVENVMLSFKQSLTEAIIATNQTLVNDLKKKGEFDEEAACHAMALTIENCKKLMTKDVLNYLENKYEDLDGLIEAMAEAIIGASKKAGVDSETVVNTVVEYLSNLPNYKNYDMETIVSEISKKLV